jgi:hypothetical protein
MNTGLYILAAIVALTLLYFIARPLIRAFMKYRGARVITCPETEAPAGVEVNALKAAFSGFGKPELRLKDCSRWPEKENCGQECLTQVEESPEDCLVRNMLTNWYSEKTCVYCDAPLGQIDWLHHKPALMTPDRKTVQWQDIRPEDIPVVLSTHSPVCWKCHVAEAFRRQHPNLVVDR